MSSQIDQRQRDRQARLLSHTALKYSHKLRQVVFYLRAHDRRNRADAALHTRNHV